jgi:drug/metabolite transporter (DMT)-like permease
MKADLLALAAIALWGTLAPLGVKLTHLPPFLLTGLGLLVGSLIALAAVAFRLSEWRVPLPTLLVGIYGLFGFHFLLFMALRTAPAVEANLINYLWPLGMVVLAPLFLPGVTLHTRHVAAALIGFAGAAIAILGRGGSGETGSGFQIGYLLALASAFVWSSYSLLTRRLPHFPTAAVGGFRGRVRPAVAGLPCGAGALGHADRRRLAAGGRAGLGAAGRGVLSVGCRHQARRHAAHRPAGLCHADPLHRAAAGDHRPAAAVERGGGGRAGGGRGPLGQPLASGPGLTSGRAAQRRLACTQRAMSAAERIAPAWRATSWPPWNSASVGMLRMLKRAARFGWSGVDLHQPHLRLQLGGGLLEGRGHHAAGAAPRRPEINGIWLRPMWRSNPASSSASGAPVNSGLWQLPQSGALERSVVLDAVRGVAVRTDDMQ